jgi:hypothetical protein
LGRTDDGFDILAPGVRFRHGHAGRAPRDLPIWPAPHPRRSWTILYTAQDIQAEHDAAVAALTPLQRRAFARVTGSGSSLERHFVLEAEARSFRPANDDQKG